MIKPFQGLLCASLLLLQACATAPLPNKALPARTPSSNQAPAADFQAEQEEEEECQLQQSASRRFLPRTQVPPATPIIPATHNDCGFYNWAWQSFLYATQADIAQRPAFLGYEPMESVFGLKAVTGLNGGFRQAGDDRAILVDQNHNPVFYSVHINSVFADFVRDKGLNQLPLLLKNAEAGGLPKDLQFPPGALELKAAWRVLEPGETATDYFTFTTRVPILKNTGQEVVATAQTREVRVALLSLHVVGVIEDHPEFIWASFEHADPAGQRDLAPAAFANPVKGLPARIQELYPRYPLFKAGTPSQEANHLPAHQLIDEASQKFTRATSIYRAYPASLSESSAEDQGVVTLNQAIARLFEQTDPEGQDLRRHYRMVGAIWLDQPGANQPEGVFKADRSFENTEHTSILAGEDALASMAMESFNQSPRMNCFSCHNTQAKVLSGKHFLPPRRLNVSNVLTLFAKSALLEEATRTTR